MATKYHYRCLNRTLLARADRASGELPPKEAVIPLVLSETGKPALKATFIQLSWDAECLHVLFSCFDTNIYGDLLNRDDPLYTEDVVEIFLSPDGDLTHYYEIEVSPRNVVFDAEIRTDNGQGDNMRADVSWDCEDLRTEVYVDGTLNNSEDQDVLWTARLAIPFAALGRKAPKHGEKWRANFYRIDRIPEPVEYQAWSPTFADPANFHVPECFGEIEFVER